MIAAPAGISERLTRHLYAPDSNQSEKPISGELSRITRLFVHEGTITTPLAVRAPRYNHVREMRIYGDHDAVFPREGIRFTRYGERPVESVTTEEHPQKLILNGKVRPSYRVKNAELNLTDRSIGGEINGSTLYVLAPTSFAIWAEYISDEERALLDAIRRINVKPVEDVNFAAPVDRHYAPGLFKRFAILAASASALGGTLYMAYSALAPAALALGPGIVYPLSLSPNVMLTFPDGRVDRDSGTQVVKFEGNIHTPDACRHPRIETQHFEGNELLELPESFGVDGRFFVEGAGKLDIPGNTLSVFGVEVFGTLDCEKDRAFLVGDMQV